MLVPLRDARTCGEWPPSAVEMRIRARSGLLTYGTGQEGRSNSCSCRGCRARGDGAGALTEIGPPIQRQWLREPKPRLHS